jgi:hypothetical protein
MEINMKNFLLLLFIVLSASAMQESSRPISESSSSTGHEAPASVSLFVVNTPSRAYTPVATPALFGFDEENGPTIQEVKIWFTRAIAQCEQEHALTLQELQTALRQHTDVTAAAQTAAQSAQDSSKSAIYVAIIASSASIIVCIASSLMSHYL